MLRKVKFVLKRQSGNRLFGRMMLSAALINLFFLPGVLRAEPVDVSQYVTATTSNERSTMDRRTRMITSTADVTITNSSQKSIVAPLQAVIEIFDTAYSNVSMPDALGGDGIDRYRKYYYDLSTMFPAEGLLPGQRVTLGVTLVRFRYNDIP